MATRTFFIFRSEEDRHRAVDATADILRVCGFEIHGNTIEVGDESFVGKLRRRLDGALGAGKYLEGRTMR